MTPTLPPTRPEPPQPASSDSPDTNTVAPAASPRVHGRVSVQQRALHNVARASAATTIGVPRGDVNVEVEEWSGGLTVRIAASLPIPDLADTASVLAETPLMVRAHGIQRSVGQQLTRLTGRPVRRVSLTIIGAHIRPRKRVR